MALLIGAALVVLSIAILAYPFFRARPQAAASREGDSGDTWGRETIYHEIRTLQLEYEEGKVPEDVYRERLGAYRLQAAAALRQQAQVAESAIAEPSSGEDRWEAGGGNAP